MLPPVICLMGPTAIGKSDLAIGLAQQLPCEIISVDSVLVYRGLVIGAAKPSRAEQEVVPHHLIDIRDPWENYSVGEFCQQAADLIIDIKARGKIPLLVGGTMMYFHALEQGLSPLPTANQKVRDELKQFIDQAGLAVAYQRLTQYDPVSAAKIKPTDKQRIQRALEVYQLSGTPLSILQQQKKHTILADFKNIILWPESREQLRAKIQQRFEIMLEKGLIAEVEGFYYDHRMSIHSQAMRTVGYHEVWQYLAGDLTYEELLTQVPNATNHLAKRQLTWLKNWPNAQKLIVDLKNYTPVIAQLKQLVQEYVDCR